MDRDALERLSKEDLITLVLAQAAQIAALMVQNEELHKRVAELETRRGPPKTPDNSSLPPAQGYKPSRAARRATKKRQGRPGTYRKLAEQPDRIVDTLAQACPHCAHPLGAADQPGVHAYDHSC